MLTILAVVGAVSATSVASAASPASARPGTAQASAATVGSGWARFGHFAPSAAPVDVFVDGAPFAASIAFKTVSDYLPLPAGLHRFQLKAAGQPESLSLLDIDANVPDGASVTVSAVTTRDGVASQVYDDALMAPPAGQSLVRFIHAAPDVAAVDIAVVGGPTLTSALPYPTATQYQVIAAGQYDVEVRAAGSSDVLIRVMGWSIEVGSQASMIIVRGLDGNLDVAPVVDAAAVASSPVGGVQTGFGGMSAEMQQRGSTEWLLPAAVIVVAMSFGFAWSIRRRRNEIAVR